MLTNEDESLGAAGVVNTGPLPSLGEHTAEVLAEAGFSPDEIDHLLAAGAARAIQS
jgi:crotonobetainyl-CoA:carnitine CoA-transferase CaiB-like acyl-CoA transferase